MRRVYNLIVLCMLLICQQHIVAQSYDLGKQKQSFAYKTLYANQVIDIQPTQIQKCEQVHKQIVNLTKYYYGGQVFTKYNNIYKSMPKTEENMLNLQKIQYVVISYLNSKGSLYPTLENQLKNASSTEAEIAIFLSYYKE